MTTHIEEMECRPNKNDQLNEKSHPAPFIFSYKESDSTLCGRSPISTQRSPFLNNFAGSRENNRTLVIQKPTQDQSKIVHDLVSRVRSKKKVRPFTWVFEIMGLDMQRGFDLSEAQASPNSGFFLC